MTNTYYDKRTAPPGSTLYYSVLFSPPEQHSAIVALHAFYQEINSILDSCTDEQVAYTKLQWWKTEIARLFKEQPRHPVTKTLLPIIQTYPIPIDIFESLIDHPNTEHLIKLIALYIPGGNQERLASYVQHLSQAMQSIDNIINFRKYTKQGRPPFSIEKVQQQAKNAHIDYNDALNALPIELRRSQLSQIIFAELQLKLLEEIEKDGFKIQTHQTQLTPLRKLWTAWRVMRREKKFLK